MSKIQYIEDLGFLWNTEDPFLFCAYHKDNYPKGNEKMGVPMEELRGRRIGQDFDIKDGYRMYHGSNVPGFPYHPHRGFETITINKGGVVDHTDSLGAAGRFMGGDVQWMTAGNGVQHSEMFPLVHEDKRNPLEIFQIWLNLPSVSKKVDPYFQMMWSENVPTVEINNGGKSKTDVISGTFAGAKALDPNPDSWASDSQNKVRVLTVELEAGAHWNLDAETGDLSRNLYFYEGESLTIEGQSIDRHSRIKLDPHQNIQVSNNSDNVSKFLLLEGKAIGESVAKYGPFVMNTMEEIEETMAEYRRTEFGGWPWPEREQVHARDRGRFALHADGKVEEPQAQK